MKIQVGKTYRIKEGAKSKCGIYEIANGSAISIIGVGENDYFRYDILKDNKIVSSCNSTGRCFKESDLILEDDINNPYVGMEVSLGRSTYRVEVVVNNVIAIRWAEGSNINWYTLDTFKRDFKIKPQEEVKPWSPEDLKEGDGFFFVNPMCQVQSIKNSRYSLMTKTIIEAGNCFQTREKAQAKADEILKLLKS